MALTSPATMLVWTVLSFGLGMFLIYHLWKFDRFKCLRWHTGPYSGTFKRAMTYTYCIGIPLIITYSLGMAVIKYEEGFLPVSTQGDTVPKPVTHYSKHFQDAILPLMICFSIGWSIEHVTHLQELCFWLFLINSRSAQQDWFRSPEFRVWVIGSITSLLYMPLVTGFTRGDPIKCEAWTFLGGGIGSTLITLAFIPILYTFPSFLESLKAEDVDMPTIVRLTKFHELNIIRIIFRSLFCLSLLVLGIDGVKTTHPINETLVATDALAILASFGFVVSSGITLVIFFPRSIESEIARDAGSGFLPRPIMAQSTSTLPHTDVEFQPDVFVSAPSPVKERTFGAYNGGEFSPIPESKPISARGMRPNRRVGSNVELGGIDPEKDDPSNPLTAANLARLEGAQSTKRYHTAAHHFRSPLDIGQTGRNRQSNASLVTFNNRIS